MSVPGCAGYVPSDESTIHATSKGWMFFEKRYVLLDQLYECVKELTNSPCGYTPKLAEIVKKLKEMER